MAEHNPTKEEEQGTGALDEKGKALQALLSETFKDISVEVSVDLDLVSAQVPRDQIVAFCQKAQEDPQLDFKALLCLSVVDYKEKFQVVYHLCSLNRRHRMVAKVDVPYDDPQLPSVTPVWQGADWYEREGAELFGIAFQGHPDPRPLLLWEGFEGHPLRKDYPFHDYQEW